MFAFLGREARSGSRARLEDASAGRPFSFPLRRLAGGGAATYLEQLREGKSPATFSLSDAAWNQDLLTLLAALDEVETETPYRVFSVRVFNDSKRFDELKAALVRLARPLHPSWKDWRADEILREFNLAANPGVIYFAGDWQFTTGGGETLTLAGFVPAVGFPAAQAASIQSVAVGAGAVLCIENLTTFHEFVRLQAVRLANALASPSEAFAVMCSMGNPSPAMRHLLRLVPEETPLYLWSDLDYGGFNILSQFRQKISRRVRPYRMDVVTFESFVRFARPLSATDRRNLRGLCRRAELADVVPAIEHLLARGLKLEQEAIEV